MRGTAPELVAPAVRHSPDCPAAAPARPRTRLFGLDVDALTMDQTVDAVRGMVGCGAPHQHVCLNAAKVVEIDRHPELADVVNGCDLVSVDGQAVVWASRVLGAPVPERVAGIDLLDHLLADAAARGQRVYLLGARDEVVRRTAEIAVARHPGLLVAGARSGYWTPEQEADVVADVAASGAAMLFVALPSPRKEHFLQQWGTQLGVPFRMGVGGSFDVMAGVTRRAPWWMQRAGLEWSYRLLQEPRRMFTRYLVGNTAFVWLVLAARRRGERA